VSRCATLAAGVARSRLRDMAAGGPDRKRIDLMALPPALRWMLVIATIAIVVGLALLFGRRSGSPTLPISAFVAAIVAFAFVAWRSQRR
jgi:hypothetical protein